MGDGDSKFNQSEALKVVEVLKSVLDTGELEPSQIGIVSPYMAQVRELRRRIRADLPSWWSWLRSLEIASVDAFQGREKELIIFSAVRSNRFGHVGFLADWRRLNVMITRARRGLVIIGDSTTLRRDPHWLRWIDWAFQNKLWCNPPQCVSPPPEVLPGTSGPPEAAHAASLGIAVPCFPVDRSPIDDEGPTTK